MTKLIRINGKIIIVSGCPRSGTSLCMDINRKTYGDDLIMGSSNLELEDDSEEAVEKRKAERLDGMLHSGQRTVMAYLMTRADDRFPQRKVRKEQRKERKETAKDMNPNGFWEHPFSVRGIRYSPPFKAELQETLKTPKILKVVSQGLMSSDPIYIDKIVLMLRHPRAVAKSQERLQREDIKGTDKQGQEWDMMERFIIHTPQMFINVTMAAMQFFKSNPEIPVKIVQYEDLLADPDTVVQSIYDFNGIEGDVEAGKSAVDTSLNRSEHQDIDNPLWDESEYIHEAMCRIQVLFDKGAAHKKIVEIVDEVLDYMAQPIRQNSIENQRFYCLRAKMQVNAANCETCMLHQETRENFRLQSEKKIKEGERNWVDEPCLFECGMDVKRTVFVSIEDSIFSNWWRKPGNYPLAERRADSE